MTLRIAEIFGPTIQGEGALIGEPTVFVRAGGCDYRCSWCDSLHAVESRYRHSWSPMSAEAVWSEVQRLSRGRPLTVSLSGGNPALQDFGPLIALGKAAGYRFACETQGSVARLWFAELETLVLSPKPPSSGETVNWDAFDGCREAGRGACRTVMKIVVFDQADYDWARTVHDRYPELELYLQPGNPEVDPETPVDPQSLADRLGWLTELAMEDGWFAPRILPQLHVLIWGNRRGVWEETTSSLIGAQDSCFTRGVPQGAEILLGRDAAQSLGEPDPSHTGIGTVAMPAECVRRVACGAFISRFSPCWVSNAFEARLK